METQNQTPNTKESQLADLESVLGPMSILEAKIDGDFLGQIIDIDVDIDSEEDTDKKLH